MTNVDAEKKLIEQEEKYHHVIHQLQSDRLRLRGKEMADRLTRIEKTDGAFNEYVK